MARCYTVNSGGYGTRMLKTITIVGALLFGAVSLQANLIIPTSTCTDNTIGLLTTPAAGFTCILYPSDGSGGYSAIANVALPSDTLPNTVSSGFIVLEDPNQVGASNIQNVTQCLDPDDCANAGAGTSGVGYNLWGTQDANTANWAQVIEWVASPETNTTATGYPAVSITLFTEGCGINLYTNINCFPNTTELLEQAYFTTYNLPDQFVYAPDYGNGSPLQHVYEVNFELAPEPATYMFAIGGFALFAAMKKKGILSR